jgi:SAM-dependent methyltransferase
VESIYFNTSQIATKAAAGQHRDLIGGLWDELGALQFEFLKKAGLQPHNKLLDVGCGSLRGGVHFVRYLEPGNYVGLDLNQSLLQAGYDIELAILGLQDRLPRENLICTGDFLLEIDTKFDFALAQSLFTHLTFNRIRQCLERLVHVMKPGGVFYATFFELPENIPAQLPQTHEPGKRVTYDTRDPYHYRVSDFEHAVRYLPWSVRYLGEWNHPRGQRLIAFTREGDGPDRGAKETREQRDLSLVEAASLPAGSRHYRAFVGPPNRFDFMSATQFSLLFANGLRDHHRVLDFGCGSLRLGRLLIPYLQEGCYFGIEPNRWLIDDAIERELGADIVRKKRAVFSYRDDFDCASLGVSFPFIMAQSIFTHCGPDLFHRLLRNFRPVLEPDGLILFSYLRISDQAAVLPKDGWHYPESVPYTETQIALFLEEAGLTGIAIPWYHPGASWHLAARSVERLPTEHERRLLTGAVLFDPQFAASRTAPK